MRLFKWSKDHEIFLPEVDAEHRNIFRAGEELYKAILSGAAPEHACTLLRGLLQAAEDHFEHEERIMREAAFPSYEWHRQQHNAVRQRAREYVARMEAGDQEARPELLKFLSSWLRDHLAVADRMMGAHIRNFRRRQQALAS